MYIYQLERDLLKSGVAEFKRYFSGKILDAGSGPNKRFKYLASGESQYISLDINPEFNPDLLGTVESVPSADNSFDFIVCSQVLGDLVYPSQAVKEFNRILKVGGHVLITEGFMNELHGEPRDYWRFTPYGLSALLLNSGFNVVSVSLLGGVFSVITQIFTRFMINSFSLYNHRFIGALFSRLFWFLGKVAIVLDRFLSTSANKKIGVDVIVLAEKKTDA